MKRKNFPGRKEQRRKVAQARVNRSPMQQLAVLDKRLGKGVGATKERLLLYKKTKDAELAA